MKVSPPRPPDGAGAGHGDEIELVIDALAAGGDGVGRGPDGRVAFVRLTAPGDRVRARVVEDRRRFVRAEATAVLAPGPDRVEPRCPVFGACGGCAWQHVDYAAQVAAKREILRDALLRIGGTGLPDAFDFTPSPSPFGYRARARVLVQGGRAGYRRHRSHALCPTARCPILVPALERALGELDTRARRREDADEGEWELAAGDGDAVRATPMGARRAGSRSAVAPRGPRLALLVGGERVALSPGVFAQSNALLFDALAAAVHDAAGDGGIAVELFAGAGFFTLGLARRFGRVVAVESDPSAVADLGANARAAGLANVEVRQARAEDFLSSDAARGADAVVLDPPRIGLAPGAAARLAAQGARRIAYLSCDPATLARDVAALRAGGYALVALRGFDLFPQTPHVEALATLDRTGAPE